MTAALTKIHFDHRLETVCDNGIVYCHCSKFHPFQGVWAHSAHVALLIQESLTSTCGDESATSGNGAP